MDRRVANILDIYVAPSLIPCILLLCSVKFSQELPPIYNLTTSGSIVSSSTLALLIYLSANRRISQIILTLTYSFVLLASSYIGYIIYLSLRSDLDFDKIRKNFQKDVVTLGTGQSYSSIVLPPLIMWFQVLISILTFLTIYRYRKRKFYFGESFILSQCISSFCLLWASVTLLSHSSNRFILQDFGRPRIELTTHLLLDSGAIIAVALLLLKLVAIIIHRGQITSSTLNYIVIGSAIILVYLRASSLLTRNPIRWIIVHIFDTHQRLNLFSIWLSTVAGCIAFSISWSQNAITSNSIMRKFFHGVIGIVFITGYNGDLHFTKFAAGAALLGFILLETVRVVRLWPVGPYLEDICRSLRSGSDNAYITINHIYLLMGLFLPVWLLPAISNKLSISSGLIAVGIGDTFAAIVGTLFGRHRITRTNKSIEGFAGGLLAQIVFKLWWIGFESWSQEINFFMASLIVSFTELFTLYDNLMLSLVMTLLTTYIQ